MATQKTPVAKTTDPAPTETPVTELVPTEQAEKEVAGGAFAYFQSQIKNLEMQVGGLKSVAAKLDRNNRDLKELVDKKAPNVTAETVASLVRRVEQQDKTIADLVEQLKAKSTPAPVSGAPEDTTKVDQLTDYVENLVEDMEVHDNPELGAGMIGFFPDTKYPKNTVGYGIKLVLDMLNNMPNALNFGAPEEQWIMNKAITVKQGFAMAKVPNKLEYLELDTIKGLKKDDILILTARGEVRLMNLTGNLKLKSDCTLISGKFIVLHRAADSWEEIGRSH